ncbi:MAG: hypothetical protein A2045_14555 [Rhodocyclales bacterium GWA2_65_20]|nr:MAG: hypothetical protein A2045_14555 [Rhodocyclales bacterium GWA2_65_20]
MMVRLIGWIAAALLCPAALAMADEVVPRETLHADIERTYESLTTAAAAGSRFAVSVDLGGDNFALAHDAAAGRLQVLYRMNFNQVAEGWSWQPQANPAQADYYRYKFLPLGSRERPQGAPYVQEDLPGRPRQVQRIWHYDYFFAFDNPYDFFPRPTVEDDAGFTADIPLAAAQARELMQPGRIGMLAWARWVEPKQAESTTFWKATDGKPVDLTLKNRYLIGKLEEIWFVDSADGRVLAKLVPSRR